MKTAQIVTVLLALCAAVAAQIVSLNGIISPTVIIIVLAVTNVVSATLPSLLPAAKDATKAGAGLLLLLAFGCTQAQVGRAQDVKAQAKGLCEQRLIERLAPVLLTQQQADIALEAARYACAAAESECVDEALKFRREQLELQKAPPTDAGAPVPAPVPETDSGWIDPNFSERK